MSRAKEIWENLAETEAYYAVATFDRFRDEHLDAESKKEFFDTGSEHVEMLWKTFEEQFGSVPNPKTAIDYGCGVGRILLPLASKCDSVTGVDISSRMLDEAKHNASEQGVENIKLLNAEEFTDDKTTYDLVHSYIVLQHIKPTIGNAVIRRLVERLNPGGFGMIHMTHTNQAPILRRLRAKLYRDVPHLHRTLTKLRGKPDLFMPMYEYDREAIYKTLDSEHCSQRHTVQTDHGLLGEMIFFRRAEDRGRGARSVVK